MHTQSGDKPHACTSKRWRTWRSRVSGLLAMSDILDSVDTRGRLTISALQEVRNEIRFVCMVEGRDGKFELV